MSALGTIVSTKNVQIKSTISVTPGATITYTITTGEDHFSMWTAGEAETINISGTQSAGQELEFLIANDGILGRTITFGTGFTSSGALVGVISKTSCIRFISNGTNFIEASRTVGI